MIQHRMMGVWDYAVLLLSLLISLAIGVYFRFSGGKQKTTKEYLLGDRNQSALPVAMSLMASFMSGVTLLGVTAEVYMFGTLFITIIGSYIFFTMVTIHLYLPVFFKLQATSTYEYLKLRFGTRVQLAASLLYTLQMVLYMGIVLYAPAISLEALTGLSRNISVLVVGTICTLYSTIGGIKAIIWTDVFQVILMNAALFSAVGVAAWVHGGLLPIWNIAKQHSRIEFFNFTPDPTVRHTTWTLFIGGGFTFLSLYAVNHTQVQRYLTMGDIKSAKRSIWLNLMFLYLLLILCGAVGLAIFSVYYTCDPLRSGRISSLDQLLPLFVMETMGRVPGVSGLFAAGVFSASLSSVSACVNSLAAVTVEDYVKPLYRLLEPNKQFVNSTALTKCLALCYGVLCMCVAFLAQYLGGLLQAGLSILGIVGGPLLGTFTLGMFLPTANEPGALGGMLSGLIAALWIGFGQPKPRPPHLPLSVSGCSNLTTTVMMPMSTGALPEYPYMYRISYLLYIVVSCCVTLLVGILISYLATSLGYQPPCAVSPDLFSPPVARYLRHKQQSNYNMELKEKILNTSRLTGDRSDS